jgi:hypothetical protein
LTQQIYGIRAVKVFGKRKKKNQSALVYINDTQVKESRTDMKSIPFSASKEWKYCVMELISIMPDAIAGVVNIILKNKLLKLVLLQE